jgi:hypothetical protein
MRARQETEVVVEQEQWRKQKTRAKDAATNDV